MIFLQRWRKKGLHQHLKRTFSSQETTFLGRPIFKGELPSFREAKSCETPTSLVHLPLPTARGLPAKDHSVHRLRSLHCRRWDLLEASDQKLPGPNDGPTVYIFGKKSWCWKKGCWWYTSLSSRKLPYKYTEFSLFLKGWRITTKTLNYSWAAWTNITVSDWRSKIHWKKQKKHQNGIM